jgi:hypothetical protein
MDAETKQDQQALIAQLAVAQQELERLVANLRAIDGELDGLATERQQYGVLHEACAALDRLRELGAAELFWGDRAAASQGEAQLLRVRSRVEGFEKQIGEIEERRQLVLEEVMRQEQHADWLSDDVLEAEEEERRRSLEWVIERELGELPLRAIVMPWTRGGEDDERFRRALRTALALCLLLALVIPRIELPIFEPDLELAVPDRVVTLMAKARTLPPPPPPVVVAEEKPKPVEETVPEAKPQAGPGKGKSQGPAEGPAKGLLAFREQLAGIQVNQQLARLGADARVTNAGASSSVVQRSMITTQGPGSSGGINLGELSRGVNGGGTGSGASAIQQVQIARATSTIAGGGGGGSSKLAGSGVTAGRTDEEIQIVFDRHKAELYRLYNRELRRDPTLRGQMILRLRIEPDGSVSLCELKGSDMQAPQLAAQVVDRVRGFDFGAKEGIGPVSILYPIDFLPAA